MLCISNVRRYKVKTREDPKLKSVPTQCVPHFASGSFLHFSLFLAGGFTVQPPVAGQAAGNSHFFWLGGFAVRPHACGGVVLRDPTRLRPPAPHRTAFGASVGDNVRWREPLGGWILVIDDLCEEVHDVGRLENQ